MLAEHGLMGRDYPQVAANTVAAFALGDYEWLLALEADELTDLVDLMRHLRGSDARRHVRLEVPFYTGHRDRPRRPGPGAAMSERTALKYDAVRPARLRRARGRRTRCCPSSSG